MIDKYKRKGWVVCSKNKDYYVLQKHKKFSVGTCIILTLLFNLFGLVAYIIYYCIKDPVKTIKVYKNG